MKNEDKKMVSEIQHQSNRWTYLGTGMTHPRFLAAIGKLNIEQRKRVENVSPVFC